MSQMRRGLRATLLPGLAILALAALTSTTSAQPTTEQQSAIRSACRSDFMSKCSGVTPGGKDALNCLQKNVASLSTACKTAVSVTIPAPAPVEAKPAQAAPAQAAPPLAPAATTTAPTTTAPAAAPPAAAPTPPAPAQRATTTAPSPPAAPSGTPAPNPQQAAKPAVPAPMAAPAPAPVPMVAAASEAPPTPTPQQMSAIKFTCRRDFSTHCRGVPPGGAEAFACLQRSAAKLTPDCKTSIAAVGNAVPPAAGPVPPPPATRTPNAPIVMTAVIGRACLRDLIRHCRDAGVGDGQKITCLMARGPSLAPLCKAALKITEPVR